MVAKKSGKVNGGCCFLRGPQTEEEREQARKWKAGELKVHTVDKPSPLVPEIQWYDEIIVETKREPTEGDVIAIARKPRWVEISLYCEESIEAIAEGKYELLGIVEEYRRDFLEATGADLMFRKVSRVDRI